MFSSSLERSDRSLSFTLRTSIITRTHPELNSDTDEGKGVFPSDSKTDVFTSASSALTVQSCLLNDINQSGTRDHDLLWDAALVSMSRGLFYGPFELRCFYDSHWWSAWDCAHIVIFLNCLMMYNFLQVL